MENNLLQIQDEIERADMMAMCLQNSVIMLNTINDRRCLNLQGTVEGSMLTMSLLLDELQESIQKAIDLICSAQQAQEEAAAQRTREAERKEAGAA